MTHADETANRKRLQIKELIREGNTDEPRTTNEKPLMCQVVLKSGYRTQGPMSMTDNGLLRLLAPGEMTDDKGRRVPIMADHYFDFSDVEAVVVLYPIKEPVVQTSSGLIIPSRH